MPAEPDPSVLNIRRIYKSGKALTVTIPRQFAVRLGLKLGDHLLLDVQGEEILLRKVDLARLAELVERK